MSAGSKYSGESVRMRKLTGPEVINLFSYSTQLSTNIILLIKVKVPTIVGILTYISMINTTSDRLLKARNFLFVRMLVLCAVESWSSIELSTKQVL